MRLFWCTAVLAAVGAAACKPSGPVRYRLDGAVTFAGKPVPMGKIYFDPVGQPGAPNGFTDIVDGRYDTDKVGKGVAGGKTSVRIQGHSKEGADAISGYGPPLFQEYTTTVELPPADSTMDFDVPPDAAKGVKKIVPLDPVVQQAGKSGT